MHTLDFFRKKVVVVTGGTDGIGRALVKILLSQGALVSTCGRNHDKLYQLQKEFSSSSLHTMVADVSSENHCKQFIESTINVFGGIDILINNAGVTKDNLLMRMSEEDFDKVIDINLKSVFNMTKAVQKIMLKNRKGSIVNMSSVVGVKGNAGQANYAASKAGMNGFTKSIALELGSRNIRCNAIAPGFIETEMTAKLNEDVVKGWRESIPLKRGGTPEDVANVCVFLASDMSAYVTGQVINVDGGMLT